MSPDPPREDREETGDDGSSDRIRRFSGEFIEGLMDDEFFIVPDAPYELDMEQESDFTDSDEDSPAQQGARNAGSPNGEVQAVQVSEQEVSFQTQGRGRYRLLIPFPVDSSNAANIAEGAAPSSIVEAGAGGRNNAIQDGTGADGANISSPVEAEVKNPISGGTSSSSRSGQENASTSQIKSPVTIDDAKQREIDLSEEKVETIKQVMKNIVLPIQAVPSWAFEVDEDAWTQKLQDAIESSDNKSSRKHGGRDSKQHRMMESETTKK
ncbi:unnamed protein product [Orchesella dallaii]|uniref:Male-enhanced antigen 1 n=1 Tax=Orchesella dallaii TaxID=48710 RepID=A0ABP1QUK3_9HEXA